jgi:ribosomal protein L16 Arg81 hydroxylase
MYPLHVNNLYASAVNILKPNYKHFPLFKKAKPLKVTISKGDLLYTPAYWWHQVESYELNIAVNFFYYPHSILLNYFYAGVKDKLPSTSAGYIPVKNSYDFLQFMFNKLKSGGEEGEEL